MRFIRELKSETRKLLERMNRQSKSPEIRDRAKCIILSYRRFSIKDKKSIFGVSRKTIYNLLTPWEDRGIIGMYNHKGRGRKSFVKSGAEENSKRLGEI